MVAAVKIVVIASVIFQAVHAFCVYNRITPPSEEQRKTLSMNVWDARGGLKSFKKTIDGYNSFACCHYKNKGCNPLGMPFRPISLNVNFSNDGKQTYQYTSQVTCDTSSGFAFYGPFDNIYVECTDSDGNVKEASLVRFDGR